MGASTTPDVSHKRFARVLDEFYHHTTIEQVPVPFVTFAQQRHEQGLELVMLSQGNLARAVMASTSNPFIFPDLDVQEARRLDPGTDRVSAVPVQDACAAFPHSRLIVINVTGQPAFYHRDIDCEVHEVRVTVHFEEREEDEEDEEDELSPEQEALIGVGEAFESTYQSGYDAVMAHAEL
jgi:NTE family protein